MIIYKITNKINGKCYIGQTSISTKERWARHCEPSSKCYGLSNAIKKYGKENFIIEELGQYKNQEDLNNAEMYFISWFNCMTPNGYNLTEGGKYESLSAESRKKSSLTHKKMFAEGKTPWLPKKGESRSPATQFKKGRISNNGVAIKCITTNQIFRTISSAAAELNVCTANIYKVLHKQRKHTKGYTFEYVKAPNGR